MSSVEVSALDAVAAGPPAPLPPIFSGWFAARGWSPRPHQLRLVANAAAGHSTLLIAPTGAGKTLAGFLPSLIALAERHRRAHRPGVHTLYVSPLKALAVDIARNLEAPVAEMGLAVRLETRTGDTPQHKRRRQAADPPDILLTTPEQVALLISSREADALFAGLRFVIFDELHSLVTSKRGDLLALGLARLQRLAPRLQAIGLSATVADPDALRAWLVPQGPAETGENAVEAGGRHGNRTAAAGSVAEAVTHELARAPTTAGGSARTETAERRSQETGSADNGREQALSPLEGESWRGGYDTPGFPDAHATPEASPTPLPTLPLKGGGSGTAGARKRASLAPRRSQNETVTADDGHDPTLSPLEGESWRGGYDTPPAIALAAPPRLPPRSGGEGSGDRPLQFPDAGIIPDRHLADLVVVKGGAKPEISILDSDERIPWSGHTARYAYPEILAAIGASRMALVFVNTRSQAEMIFQELWRINDAGLPIALHHGSLDAGQRRRVEAAMAAGQLRAVVCTSTLDLGIDWGDVDLVINVGAPKGASRLAQRIGRANHRLDEPSRAILVPANRFEVMECRAALDANYLGAQDTPPVRPGALDVLAQHVLGMACAAPFDALALYEEIVSAAPYRWLDWETFERVIDFVATGGYALRSYERYAKIRRGPDGLWRIAHPRVAQQYRLNVGTIIEAPMLNVRLTRMSRNAVALRGGKVLGRIEEGFIEALAPGDTFLFAGQILRFEGIRDNEAIATRTRDETPKIPIYAGGKFPITTFLAGEVRAMLADPTRWKALPNPVADWLRLQDEKSLIPRPDQLLVETFPRGARFYLAAYPFEGRLAHQTLGMLLTRRLERAGLRPTGFVATDYSICVWGLRDLGAAFARREPSVDELFEEDMLGDDLEAWMADSYLLKRTFRAAALISGLIEKRHPGEEKSGRQVTVSSDLIYDVLRQHEPDHILLRATWADAATGLLDVARLGEMLSRVRGRIIHKRLDRVSPLAVPIMLEIGKEAVDGEAREDILRDASGDDLIREAMG